MEDGSGHLEWEIGEGAEIAVRCGQAAWIIEPRRIRQVGIDDGIPHPIWLRNIAEDLRVSTESDPEVELNSPDIGM